MFFSDGRAQEIVPLLRAVPFEGGAVPQLIHGGVHGGTAGRWQGLGHVADAAANEALGGLRVGRGEGRDAPPDFGKEVAGFELEVVFVEIGHGQMMDESGARVHGTTSGRAARGPRVNGDPRWRQDSAMRGRRGGAVLRNR